MKKLLFVAIAVFGFTTANAQEVKFGAKAGVNLASISGDETGDLDGRTSFHIGGVAEIMISEKFSVQPELLYSAQGAKYEESFTEFGLTVTEEAVIKYDYLNIPIMAKFYVADNLSIEAGPQIGFLISSEAEYEGTVSGEGVSESDSETEDLKDFTSSTDFGINFGLGYKLDSGLNFGARYNLGLSNVNDGEGSENFERQNNVIQVSVGYMF